ncbi:MAG: WYL domain-containing protein [Bdellovibrionaceae bacterium]|nr:WYL domain-containing protein [Pseudobdellovibrionaceae bacterium]
MVEVIAQGAAGWEKRRVEPVHLACVQSQWYCFGHDLQRDALRTFVLARMKSARATDRTFTRTAKFDIRKHLRGSFGVFATAGGRKKPMRCASVSTALPRSWCASASGMPASRSRN